MQREVRLFDEIDRFAAGHEVSHALALSFGYDGDVANERIWTPLVERYGLRHPIAIADGNVAPGTALGVTVLKAARSKGVFHPKLFLAVREDAVLAAIGSANMTRGGLGANLELVTALTFSRDADPSPPRSLLIELLGFLRAGVLEGLRGRVHRSSVDAVAEVIRHAQIVADGLPERSRGPELSFVHSYDEALWPQLRRLHGDDAVEQLLAVSPFFEVDDPNPGENDSFLLHACGDGLPWVKGQKGPRCRLFVAPIGPGSVLPRAALNSLGDVVELHHQQASIEPRRLHAKLLGLFGKKRTTLLWGSPNFTPSAMSRAAKEGGNVECALVLSSPAGSITEEATIGALDLASFFARHRGAVPPGSLLPPPVEVHLEVGEAVYDPATRLLNIYGETFTPLVVAIRARLRTAQGELPLIDAAIASPGTFDVQSQTPDIEEIDPETGQRRLRGVVLVVEGVNADGQMIAEQLVRLNVVFDDAIELRSNLLLDKQVLTADGLLVPSTAPPEQRFAALDAQIEAWKIARRDGGTAGVRHQASLDTFFRNVRAGLDARWRHLVQRQGSRFALLRWSRELRRALDAAVEGPLEPARRCYLTARVSEHVGRVLDAIPGWHATPGDVYASLDAWDIALALERIPLEDGLNAGELLQIVTARSGVISTLRSLPS